MLTVKKRLFIEKYKQTYGNATESAKLAGYSPRCAYALGSRLLKDADVSLALKTWEKEEALKLVPSKEHYIKGTFQREKDCDHWPTRAKLWELGGRTLNYVQGNQDQSSPSFQIIANELNIVVDHNSVQSIIPADVNTLDIVSNVTP